MKAFLVCAFFTLPLAAKDVTPATASATAAEKFLATLDAAAKAKAARPFDADERENWRYTPQERAGLPLKEMNGDQRAAAMALLDAAVSEKGQLKLKQIMTLEGVLAELEKNPEKRDPTKYYFTVFGTPADAKGWGWRYEGHHVSLNLTYVDGKAVSVTPSFLGANPADVRQGAHKGLRVLAAEEDLARTLVGTLLAAHKKGRFHRETAGRDPDGREPHRHRA